MVALSIVIATSGRPTLKDTIAAIDLADGDEILILKRRNPWGNQTKNEALGRCAGTHILFIDDDDTYTPEALTLIRAHLEQEPDRVHLYAMRYPHSGRTLQAQWPLEIGKVSGQIAVVPNQPGRLGRWTDRYEGDYDFLHSTFQLRGDEPVVHADVIAHIGVPTPERQAA